MLLFYIYCNFSLYELFCTAERERERDRDLNWWQQVLFWSELEPTAFSVTPRWTESLPPSSSDLLLTSPPPYSFLYSTLQITFRESRDLTSHKKEHKKEQGTNETLKFSWWSKSLVVLWCNVFCTCTIITLTGNTSRIDLIDPLLAPTGVIIIKEYKVDNYKHTAVKNTTKISRSIYWMEAWTKFWKSMSDRFTSDLTYLWQQTPQWGSQSWKEEVMAI